MSPASESDDLQFQKAEFAGRKCTACHSVIGDSFYQIQGRDACPGCAQARLASQNTTDSGGKMLKALLWGLGAALLGATGYALILFAGFQLSIISIGIGWLVGTAIKKGTDGHTSRKYQIMAVLLTYLAIAFSFLPVVIAGVIKNQGTEAASSSKNRATVPQSSENSENEVVGPRQKASTGSLFLAISMAAVFTVGLPLIAAFGNMPAGLITLLIIFFGLQQAWKQTKPDDALVAGPYQNNTP